MRDENRLQLPAVRIKNLPDLTAGLLIAAAVDDTDFILTCPDKPDFRRTVNIIAVSCSLYQFVHCQYLLKVWSD